MRQSVSKEYRPYTVLYLIENRFLGDIFDADTFSQASHRRCPLENDDITGPVNEHTCRTHTAHSAVFTTNNLR